MAQIGLKSFKYNEIDPTTKKYKVLVDSKVPTLQGAIEDKASLDFAEGKLYADDALAESDRSFKSGKLSLVVSDDDDTIFAGLLGHVVTSGEVVRNVDDQSPYIGFGKVITKMVNGIKKYKVVFFPRVQFKPFVTDSKTRGENIDFGTSSVEGTIYALSEVINGMTKGTYEKHKTFDTEEAAITYLDGLLTPTV